MDSPSVLDASCQKSELSNVIMKGDGAVGADALRKSNESVRTNGHTVETQRSKSEEKGFRQEGNECPDA
eukprot:6184315-Pleurochrysis_carterae.AAC.1